MKRRQFLLLALLQSSFSNLFAKSSLLTGIVLDDGYLKHHISSSHPESPARYWAIKQKLAHSSLADRLLSLRPLSIEETAPWLLEIHTPSHIEAIKKTETDYQNALLATAGCLSALDALMSAKCRNVFCASRPPGHHALNTGREEGFCYFNNIAITARYAQKKYGLKKILIVDWDYHHGNGTEAAFYSDPSVLFFSTHDQYAYPGTGSPSHRGEGDGHGLNINVHLACGSDEETMLSTFDEVLTPAVEKFQPELILISAGFDSRQDDLLGCFEISDEGFYRMTSWMCSVAEKYCDGRLISVLEGGYNIEGNASAAISHVTALADYKS